MSGTLSHPRNEIHLTRLLGLSVLFMEDRCVYFHLQIIQFCNKLHNLIYQNTFLTLVTNSLDQMQKHYYLDLIVELTNKGMNLVDGSHV